MKNLITFFLLSFLLLLPGISEAQIGRRFPSE